MGRPKNIEPSFKQISLNLTMNQIDGLAVVAREVGSSSAQLIRDFINEGLRRASARRVSKVTA